MRKNEKSGGIRCISLDKVHLRCIAELTSLHQLTTLSDTEILAAGRPHTLERRTTTNQAFGPPSGGLALERGVNNVGPMAVSAVKALEALGVHAPWP